MKKFLTMILVVLLMVGGMTAAVSAATIQDVVDALTDGGVPEVYVLQAEAYLEDRGLTSAEADQLLIYIGNAVEIADGETQLSQLTSAQNAAIFEEIKDAAALLNLTVTYDNEVLNVKNASNQIVFTVSKDAAVKQTGFDYSIVLYGLAFLLLAGVSGLVIARKVRRGRQ